MISINNLILEDAIEKIIPHAYVMVKKLLTNVKPMVEGVEFICDGTATMTCQTCDVGFHASDAKCVSNIPD